MDFAFWMTDLQRHGHTSKSKYGKGGDLNEILLDRNISHSSDDGVPSNPRPMLTDVVVDPKARRQGIARHMVSLVSHFGDSRGWT